MKKVLVIVVTYNGKQWLSRCLGSVSAVGVPETVPSTALKADLFVIDNDSTDGSADFVQANFPSAKLIRSAENLGFSKANNIGIQYALDHGYDYVYLLNQDAWLEEGALDKLVSTAESHPEYAVLSPLQMTDGYQELDFQFSKLFKVQESTLFRKQCHIRYRGSGPFMEAAVDPPKTPNRWTNSPKCQLVHQKRQIGGQTFKNTNLSTKNAKSVDRAGVAGTEYLPEPYTVNRVMAAHWLVPVEALRKVGLFNEDLFPLYGQDDNWCHRARYHGYKIAIVPEAHAVHDRAQRTEDKDKLIFRNYYMGSLVRLANPNIPMWLSYIYVLAFTLVKAIKYHSLKVFKYFFRINSQLPALRQSR